MEKKGMFFIIMGMLFTTLLLAQENVKKFEPNGKSTATVFFNYHYDFTQNIENRSQFEILRAYFGHNYNFSENFSARVLLDFENDGKKYAAFLKNAALFWKVNNLITLEAGVINTHTWDLQEKFYGYRYIFKTIQDEYDFYRSADLGFKANFKPFSKMEMHLGLWNGDGYKKLQDSYGMHKISADMVYMPVEGLLLKAYYDFLPKRDTAAHVSPDALKTQQLANFFVGYEKKDVFRLGLEYDMLFNANHKKDQKLTGISIYGTYVINHNYEIFARFDQLASNKMGSASEEWNIQKDNSMILTGIQYAPVKGVKMALNYRHFIPKKSGIDLKDQIYLNLEYKF